VPSTLYPLIFVALFLVLYALVVVAKSSNLTAAVSHSLYGKSVLGKKNWQFFDKRDIFVTLSLI
jgi:hypothetical protein